MTPQPTPAEQLRNALLEYKYGKRADGYTVNVSELKKVMNAVADLLESLPLLKPKTIDREPEVKGYNIAVKYTSRTIAEVVKELRGKP